MRIVAVFALGLLVACGTPQERCLWRAGSDLRALQAERDERQRNLERGHALERRLVPALGLALCAHPATGQPIPCAGFSDRWETVVVPINPRIEARRIALLDQLIAEERARLPAAEAACRARFPQA
jgi:hypothetical protein